MAISPLPLAFVLALALAAGLGPLARAAVIDSQPAGFTVEQELDIAAPPAKVWEALAKVGAWWDSQHTYSGDAKNLTLELKPGGCWCEALPSGGGARHMTVVYVRPQATLRAIGALGPLQALGAAGSMTWSLKAVKDHTLLTWTYDVGGHAPGGLDKFAGAVDLVLTRQGARLKSFVETGAP